MATPTYQQLIQMLSKAEGEAGDSAASVAELLTAKFSCRFPHVRVGRPGRSLETVRRIAGPIKHQRLNGSARRSYLKRWWTPRTRNTTHLGVCECHIVRCIPNFAEWSLELALPPGSLPCTKFLIRKKEVGEPGTF